MKNEVEHKTNEQLIKELTELRHQLEEANDTIEAIRTGQIDALVVHSDDGPQLYTLKSADQTYRVFIERMTEGAITLNPDGIILYCNSQFARMVGVPLSQTIGMPFENFIAPENISEFRKLFTHCWQSDCKGEVMLQGTERTPVQLSLTAIEMDEGVSLSIILTDLTSQKIAQKELKRNNEQLADANKALEVSNHDLQQFASVASHDLQEPLRKIQIFSNLLKDQEIELDPKSMKYLEKIIDSSTRMKALIIDILNYSKLSANDHALECIDLSELFKELMEDFELIIEEKKAVIEVDPLPCIDVNRGQMRQVFQNLISNALKFSKAGEAPQIRVRCKRVSDRAFDSAENPRGLYCIISVEDKGIGFDDKYQSNIFALFERLNSKDKYEGTGIGMAIAKKIIDKHNGLITATGKEGEGATFKILLPMTQTVS